MRVRTYTYADRKHIACGGKKMREWGRSLKEEEEKKNRNEILLIAGFGRKKNSTIRYPSIDYSRGPSSPHTLTDRPRVWTHLFSSSSSFLLFFGKIRCGCIHTHRDCLTALMFFSLIHSLSAWWWLQRPRRSFFPRSSRPKNILCKRNQNHNVQCIGKD